MDVITTSNFTPANTQSVSKDSACSNKYGIHVSDKLHLTKISSASTRVYTYVGMVTQVYLYPGYCMGVQPSLILLTCSLYEQ